LLCSHNIALQLRKSFGASYLDTNIPSTSRPTLNELVTFLQQESRWINVYSGLRPDQRQQLFNLFFDVDFLGDLNATVHDITVQEAIVSMRYYMGNNGEHHATLHTALLWMLGVPTLDRTHPSVVTKKFGECVKERNLKNRHGSRPFFAEVKGFNSQRKEEIMEDEEKRGTFLRPKTFQKEREKMMGEIGTMRKEVSANRTQNGVMKTMLLMEMQARKCWHGIRPGGFCGVWPKAAGMRPEACGPHGLPPAPMLRSRASPGSNARHWSPDVILGFAEYALFFPIYSCLSFSLFAL